MASKPPPSKGALAALIGTGAAAILMTQTPRFEGWVLKGYRDPVGIPTKCAGDTYDVQLGKAYSDAECRDSLNRQLLAHAAPVMACIPGLRGRDGPTAAMVDLSYNAGVAGTCNSSAARLMRQGRWEEGCRAIGRWVYAGGRKLPGLVRRRAFYVNLCLRGLA